jgi:hypothetical protein
MPPHKIDGIGERAPDDRGLGLPFERCSEPRECDRPEHGGDPQRERPIDEHGSGRASIGVR